MITAVSSILEHLDEQEPLTAWEVAYDFEHITEGRAVPRTRECRLRGGNPATYWGTQYDITGQGHRYLQGEINADNYRPVPGLRPPEGVGMGSNAEFG